MFTLVLKIPRLYESGNRDAAQVQLSSVAVLIRNYEVKRLRCNYIMCSVIRRVYLLARPSFCACFLCSVTLNRSTSRRGR